MTFTMIVYLQTLTISSLFHCRKRAHTQAFPKNVYYVPFPNQSCSFVLVLGSRVLFTIMFCSHHLPANNDVKSVVVQSLRHCTTTDPPSTVSQGSAKGSRSIALYTVTSWSDQLYNSSNGELRRDSGGCGGHCTRQASRW